MRLHDRRVTPARGGASGAAALIAFRVMRTSVATAADADESLDRRQSLSGADVRRARAIGLWGVPRASATGLGPSVGGSLNEWLGPGGALGLRRHAIAAWSRCDRAVEWCRASRAAARAVYRRCRAEVG